MNAIKFYSAYKKRSHADVFVKTEHEALTVCNTEWASYGEVKCACGESEAIINDNGFVIGICASCAKE